MATSSLNVTSLPKSKDTEKQRNEDGFPLDRDTKLIGDCLSRARELDQENVLGPKQEDTTKVRDALPRRDSAAALSPKQYKQKDVNISSPNTPVALAGLGKRPSLKGRSSDASNTSNTSQPDKQSDIQTDFAAKLREFRNDLKAVPNSNVPPQDRQDSLRRTNSVSQAQDRPTEKTQDSNRRASSYARTNILQVDSELCESNKDLEAVQRPSPSSQDKPTDKTQDISRRTNSSAPTDVSQVDPESQRDNTQNEDEKVQVNNTQKVRKPPHVDVDESEADFWTKEGEEAAEARAEAIVKAREAAGDVERQRMRAAIEDAAALSRVRFHPDEPVFEFKGKLNVPEDSGLIIDHDSECEMVNTRDTTPLREESYLKQLSQDEDDSSIHHDDPDFENLSRQDGDDELSDTETWLLASEHGDTVQDSVLMDSINTDESPLDEHPIASPGEFPLASLDDLPVTGFPMMESVEIPGGQSPMALRSATRLLKSVNAYDGTVNLPDGTRGTAYLTTYPFTKRDVEKWRWIIAHGIEDQLLIQEGNSGRKATRGDFDDDPPCSCLESTVDVPSVYLSRALDTDVVPEGQDNVRYVVISENQHLFRGSKLAVLESRMAAASTIFREILRGNSVVFVAAIVAWEKNMRAEDLWFAESMAEAKGWAESFHVKGVIC